jgi:hypothetical protein
LKTKLVQRALHPHSRGVLAQAQRRTHFLEAFVLEITEQDRETIFLAEIMHGFIQHGSEIIPFRSGCRVVEKFIHGIGLLFARLPALLGAVGVQCHPACRRVKPSGKGGMFGEALSLPGKFGKNLLSHIFGAMRVTAYQTKRGRINQVHMPPNQFGKGGFRLFGSVAGQ